MGDHLLVLHNISKYYVSGGKVTPALHRIDLSLQRGEFVAITGESGSGKTTLLNVINGTLIPDSGEVLYSGTKISDYDQEQLEDYQKNQIGYIYQDYRLILHYTVLENIMGAMLLQGVSTDVAKQRAEEILRKVGMENYAGYKASKLSAGQKQRLGIARVLAKESKIIIADEPTANLDKETGAQIMELLKTMSRDHLVIIVTHNIEEAKGYVSRMIRIHSGRIEDDYSINQDTESVKEPEVIKDNKAAEVPDQPKPVKKSRITSHFLSWNLKNSIGKGLLLTILFVLASVMTLVFFNLFYRNTDETVSMIYSDKAFRNMNDKRIIIRHKDDSPITREDQDVLKKLTYVTDSEFYDCVTDINYYALEGIDYKYEYFKKYRDMRVLRNDRFMRSAISLEESDLYLGRFPESIDEIVVCSTDESLLGQTLTTYFNQGIYAVWGRDCLCVRHLKVVGLASGSSGQTYFSEELCDMFASMYSGASVQIHFLWNATTEQYGKLSWIIPVIDVTLKGNAVAMNRDYRSIVVPSAYGESMLTVNPFNDSSGKYTKKLNVNAVDMLYNDVNTQQVTVNGREVTFFVESHYPYADVSEELFYQIYDSGNSQMAVYIDDYVHTDEVLRQIRKAGNYIADSTYRLSRSGYDKVKEQNRKQVLFSAVFSLFVLGIGVIILVNALLYSRKKDYETVMSMGMNRFRLWRITIYELLLYVVAAYGITACLVYLLYNNTTGSIMEYLKYFEMRHYVYCSIFYLAIMVFTIVIFWGVLNWMVKPRAKRAGVAKV